MIKSIKQNSAFMGFYARKGCRLLLKVSLMLLLTLPCLTHYGQEKKPNKIQEMVSLIKGIYKYEDKDYITDGKKIVWVKSYRRWEPSDLYVLKKENLHSLLFLKDACKHSRYDVLKQLMPDYYLSHGGVTAYADDINNIQTS